MEKSGTEGTTSRKSTSLEHFPRRRIRKQHCCYKEISMHHASQPGRRTASLCPVEWFVRGMSASRPKMGSRETCLLHPTQLGLELNFPVD